jgi:hypothetical protein
MGIPIMKTAIVALAVLASCLVAQEASAAIKFMRFAHCADGLVTVKTCECHGTTTRHFAYCHTGQYCHTYDGTCHK